jgi:hypothetical protein
MDLPQRAKSLEEQERELLIEIQGVENMLAISDERCSIAQHRQERDIVDLETQLILRRGELNEQRASIETKRTMYRQKAKQREMDIRQQATDELNAIRESIEEEVARRGKGLTQSIEESIAATEKSVAKLAEQKELLLLNGAFTAQGIFAAIHDASTVEDKLVQGLGLIQRYVNHHLSLIRERIVDIIRRETTAAAHAVWEQHKKLAQHEAEVRRESFIDFLKSSLDRFAAFTTERDEKRESLLLSFREKAAQQGESMRKSLGLRCEAMQQESLRQIEDQSKKFSLHVEESMKFMAAKENSVIASDAVVAQQQVNELLHRCEAQFNIQQHLLQAQKERIENMLKQMEAVAATPIPPPLHPGARTPTDVALQLSQQSAQIEQKLQEQIARQKQRVLLMQLGPDEPGVRMTSAIMTVETDEERHLVSLVRERTAVLEDLSRCVGAEAEHLDVDRRRCDAIRLQVGVLLDDLMRLVQDNRLMQHSEQTRIDAIRNRWEAEHRQCLSAGHRLEGDVDEGSASIGFIHPFLQGLLEASSTVAKRAMAVAEHTSKHAKESRGIRRGLQEDLQQGTEKHEAVHDAWVRLYDALLKMNCALQNLADEEVKLIIEEGKKKLEEDLLAGQRAALSGEIESLAEHSKRVQEECEEALEQKSIQIHELRRLESEQQKMAVEQRKLSVLQSDLLHRQREHFDKAMRSSYVHGRESRSPLSDSSSPTGVSSMSSPESPENAERPLRSTNSRSRLARPSPFADLVARVFP